MESTTTQENSMPTAAANRRAHDRVATNNAKLRIRDRAAAQAATCDICSQPLHDSTPTTVTADEACHTACISHWFTSNWGRETLS